MYLLAREWGARAEGALLAAVAFVFQPNLVAVGAHGHGSQLVDSAYLPLLLWLAVRWLRRGQLLDLGFLALAGGFQFLRGHVQICFYTWMASDSTLVFDRRRPASPARIARSGSPGAPAIAIAAALAFGIAGVYNLPLRDYAQYSIRGSGRGGRGRDRIRHRLVAGAVRAARHGDTRLGRIRPRDLLGWHAVHGLSEYVPRDRGRAAGAAGVPRRRGGSRVRAAAGTGGIADRVRQPHPALPVALRPRAVLQSLPHPGDDRHPAATRRRPGARMGLERGARPAGGGEPEGTGEVGRVRATLVDRRGRVRAGAGGRRAGSRGSAWRLRGVRHGPPAGISQRGGTGGVRTVHRRPGARVTHRTGHRGAGLVHRAPRAACPARHCPRSRAAAREQLADQHARHAGHGRGTRHESARGGP